MRCPARHRRHGQRHRDQRERRRRRDRGVHRAHRPGDDARGRPQHAGAGRAARAIASEAGYAYSDAEVEKFFLEQASLSGAGERPDVESPAFLDLGRFLLQYNEISSSQDAQAILTELGTAVQEAELTVNPRYGQANEEGVIVPTAREWIQQDEQAATPAG
ncbi:hypothetical protein [Georgenia sp. SUBG003]|uniref:hypothetical protein n=1 Tax=Georgenia sp. SUBG003 TaxID=1497974 RepID=UPI0004D70035|nr:hypothetical protein DA06_02920 [Georgenia sp. SUBG003]